jgi:hypothetical protein
VKAAERCWHLNSSLRGTIGTYTTRKAAEAGKDSGPYVALREKEVRWMRGAAIPGWRPYDEVRAEREAAAAFTHLELAPGTLVTRCPRAPGTYATPAGQGSCASPPPWISPARQRRTSAPAGATPAAIQSARTTG